MVVVVVVRDARVESSWLLRWMFSRRISCAQRRVGGVGVQGLGFWFILVDC